MFAAFRSCYILSHLLKFYDYSLIRIQLSSRGFGFAFVVCASHLYNGDKKGKSGQPCRKKFTRLFKIFLSDLSAFGKKSPIV